MDWEPKPQTRRAVLVSIGGAAVGLGLPNLLPAGTPAAPELPPGVYLPSSDDLGHALMSLARFHPIPPDCPTDYIRPRSGPFAPLFFSAAEFPVIRRLAQLLLGGRSPSGNEDSVVQEIAEWIDLRVASAAGIRSATRAVDSPNRALAVAYFGADKIAQLETDDPEKICREGLVWLSETARARGSGQFLSLPEEQQISILHAISDERPDINSGNAGTRLFALLKAETVRGYYTSQAGLKELDFKGNAFYARSPGCDSKPRQQR